MSRYVQFLLERRSVPPLREISVLRFSEEWANLQIADELRLLYPGAQIQVVDRIGSNLPDLIVLPYASNFSVERPGGYRLYRRLRQAGGAWVLCYGLTRRVLEAMPARALLGHYRRYRWTNRLAEALARFGLASIARRVLLMVVGGR